DGHRIGRYLRRDHDFQVRSIRERRDLFGLFEADPQNTDTVAAGGIDGSRKAAKLPSQFGDIEWGRILEDDPGSHASDEHRRAAMSHATHHQDRAITRELTVG